MGNELNCDIGTPGLTVTAMLLKDGVSVVSGIACPDDDGIGFYSGDMPTSAAADYYVRFISVTKRVGGGRISWDGTREVTNKVLQTAINNISGGGGAGDGPYTVVVTVKDGSDNLLDNANVQIRSNGISVGFAKTVDGVAELFVENGDYEVIATCVGFNGGSESVTVSGGDEEVGVDLSQFTPATSATGLVTGYLTCVDVSGNPASGVDWILTVVELPTDGVGLGVITSDRTVTSGTGENNVQFADLVPHGVYTIQGGDGDPVQFEALETDFPIPISGRPSE